MTEQKDIFVINYTLLNFSSCLLLVGRNLSTMAMADYSFEEDDDYSFKEDVDKNVDLDDDLPPEAVDLLDVKTLPHEQQG